MVKENYIFLHELLQKGFTLNPKAFKEDEQIKYNLSLDKPWELYGVEDIRDAYAIVNRHRYDIFLNDRIKIEKLLNPYNNKELLNNLPLTVSIKMTLNYSKPYLRFQFRYNEKLKDEIKKIAKDPSYYRFVREEGNIWKITLNSYNAKEINQFITTTSHYIVYNSGKEDLFKDFANYLSTGILKEDIPTAKPEHKERFFRHTHLKPFLIWFGYSYDSNIYNDMKKYFQKIQYSAIENTWEITITKDNIFNILNFIDKYDFKDVDNQKEYLLALQEKFLEQEREAKRLAEQIRLEEEVKRKLAERKSYNYDPTKNLLKFKGLFSSEELNKLNHSARGELKYNKFSEEYIVLLNEFNGKLLLDDVINNIDAECDSGNKELLIDNIIDTFEKKEEIIKASHKSHTEPFIIPGFNKNFKPFPFQYAGIEFGHKFKKCIIADEQGLGKTLQAIGIIAMDKSFPALIIPPANVKFNWKKEFLKWLEFVDVEDIVVINGRNFVLPEDTKSIYIINYDLLKQYLELLKNINFKSLVLDEAHYIKNVNSKRYQYISQIVKDNNLEILLPLTGTPILNRVREFKPLITILDKWHVFGGEQNFNKSYLSFNNPSSPINDIKDEQEKRDAYLSDLNERLRSSCMIRREKADVMKDLPDKLYTDIPVEITNRKEYDKAEQEMLEWMLSGGLKSMLDPIDVIKKSHKLTDSEIEKLTDEEIETKFNDLILDKTGSYIRAEHLVRIENLKQLSLKGKEEFIYEWIDDFLDATDKKLVVFAIHKNIVKTISEKYSCPAIYGGVNAEKRQEAVDIFQNDISCRLIVLNIIAGGEGITLTASSDLLFIEYYWNPGKMDQASDRVHRIGQKDTVNIYNMYGSNTIDEDIVDLIERKRRIVRGATQGVFIDDRKKVNDTEFLINRIKARNKK
jgi:SWI/SNF-related matrix-associated actin-dependent regulator 1 of chromatin subfamily A